MILFKDHLTLHILNVGTDIGRMECYLKVDDLDGLWQNIKGILKGRKVREPFNQGYGMRVIHIGVPETNTLIFIGQEIKAN
jgi:hypothetical protein